MLICWHWMQEAPEQVVEFEPLGTFSFGGEMLPLRLGFLVVSFALKWSTGQVLLLNWSTKASSGTKMVCWVPLQNAAAECRLLCALWSLGAGAVPVLFWWKLCCLQRYGRGAKTKYYSLLLFAMFKPKQKKINASRDQIAEMNIQEWLQRLHVLTKAKVRFRRAFAQPMGNLGLLWAAEVSKCVFPCWQNVDPQILDAPMYFIM